MSEVTQPKVLPFPGYPNWGLWWCRCWREIMPKGEPQLPQHIAAALTIEAPKGGHAVTCDRCRSSWFYRASSKDWLLLKNDVEVRMTGAERLMYYKEGLANEALDADAPQIDLDYKPEP